GLGGGEREGQLGGGALHLHRLALAVRDGGGGARLAAHERRLNLAAGIDTRRVDDCRQIVREAAGSQEDHHEGHGVRLPRAPPRRKCGMLSGQMRPFALCLLLAACSDGKPQMEATVLVGRASDIIGLDPARITDSDSAEVTEQIYDHLVRYRADSTEIEPALATGWEVSADGRTWTFHLRSNVRFHDGTPFDADAVVFSFDRQRDPHHPYHSEDFTYS